MGSEPVEELPEDLEAWVTERASADDASRADVIRRLMAAQQLLDEHPDRLEDADASDLDDVATEHSDTEVDDLETRVEEIAERVEALEGDLDEKITDVRERVIQVKREADAKAPADHDHPAIERRVDEGFGNYEEILEYLTERTETLQEEADDRSAKLRRVANAVVDLRERVAALEGELEGRAAVADLREAANRRGISEAACGSCGKSVRVGLLDEPACPHCETPFDGIESGGWFRSDRLTVGGHPALESAPTPSDTGSSPSQSNGRDRSDSESSTDTAGGGPEGADPRGKGGRPEPSDTTDEPPSDSRDSGFAGDPVDGSDEDDREASER